MRTRKICFILVLLTGLSLIGCRGKGQEGTLTKDQEAAKKRMDSLRDIAAHTAQVYKEMDNPALLKKLAEQSRQKKEPFNSLAYRELQTRSNVDPNALEAMVREARNADGLLPLLLLRKLHIEAYDKLPMGEKVSVLTDALATSNTFNTWGMPGLYVEDASRALLACDSTAFPALRKMLFDTRPAPVFGSKHAMVYQRYQFRLCDYALFFLVTMQGNKAFQMPVSPAGRDSVIKTMIH